MQKIKFTTLFLGNDLGYVFRIPKLWSGPSGEKPPEIEKALKEVKKRKQSSFIKMKPAFISCQC